MRSMGAENEYLKSICKDRYSGYLKPEECLKSDMQRFDEISGGFGGFNRSLDLASLPPDSLANEFISFSMYVPIPPAQNLLTNHQSPDPTARNSSTLSST